MAAETIRVIGYRETARALNNVNKKAKLAVFAGLRKAGEPIAADAMSRLSRYQGLSTATIRPSARISGLYVTQRAKKVSGLRPDFGALQMRKGFIPALEAHSQEIVDDVEAAILVLTKLEGF